MTSLQLGLLAGMTMMLGPVLLLFRYAPRHPELGDYLAQLSPATVPLRANQLTEEPSLEDRLGWWLQRQVGDKINLPKDDLDILRIAPHQHLAQRALFGLIGLLFPTLLSVVLWIIGVPVSLGIPVIGSLLLGAVFSFIPVLNVRTDAQEAREEFRYVLGSYMDLVALERRASASPSPRQAMAQAATVADHWVFRRLAEELAHSRLSGVAPWDRLRELGIRYRITELTELGNIMRIAGEESASVYETLAQRSRAMRKAHLAKELTAANEVSTKRSAPVALLGGVFMVMLIIPGVLGMVGL